MPVIKQKTVDGDTLQLKRARTQKDGKRYEYYVTEEGGAPIGDPVYTREEGMREFRETVSAYETRAESDDRGMGGGFMGGGFMSGGGGGGPEPVGFGMGTSDDEDDDDDNSPAWMF